MSSTITVTLIGATGFIGRRIARRLLADGHRVLAAVRADSAQLSGLSEQVEIRHCRLRRGDAGLRAALDGAGAVIYAAGAVRGAKVDDFRAANVDGVAAVAAMLGSARGQVPPLLLISSLAASQPHLSDYARSKRDGERVLEGLTAPACTIFRPPAVYGPGDREMRPLFDAIRRGLALRTGPREQRLSMLHADDLAGAVSAWLESDLSVGHGVIELHDGRDGGYSFDEIVRAAEAQRRVRQFAVPAIGLAALARVNVMLAGITGQLPMLSPGKVRELRHLRWVCDNKAIEQAIGWSPGISLEQGIEQLYSRESER